MPRAGGDDQRVVRELRAVEMNEPIVDIEAADIAQQHFAVRLPLENRPQRRGDICRRQPAGRHLVQQRLKQMKIAAIDERDYVRVPAAAPGRRSTRQTRRRR